MSRPDQFYDPLAANYDRIFKLDRRLAAARAFVGALRERLGSVGTAVDAACGTGLYALALAKSGVRTIGADLSPAMIEQAAANSRRLKLEVEWRVCPMQKPATDRPVDLILCMGNSLPHLLDRGDLLETMRTFRDGLRSGGSAVCHLLNYRKILKTRERIVGIDRDGEDRQFVRFYDFPATRNIVFNLLTIEWPDSLPASEPETDLQSVELNPYTDLELDETMREAGFGGLQRFGGLDFTPFLPEQSETLLLTARRP